MAILPPIEIPPGPIKLGVVGDDGVIVEKREIRRSCIKHRYEVDVHARTVQCPECGKFFDPLEALLDFSRDYDRYRQQYNHLVRTLGEAKKEFDNLMRLIRNARATLRRKGETPPPPRYFHG